MQAKARLITDFIDYIVYNVFYAEKTHIHNSSIDLIMAAMAVHWFDFKRFYGEVRRVGRRNGIIAVWSYGMHTISPKIDKISERLNFGGDILGSYWSKEIIYVHEEHKTIPFPFRDIESPRFEMKVNWSLVDLFNYMQTWSAVKKFYMEKKYNPLYLVREDFVNLWGKGDEHKIVRWIINLRVGIIQN